MSDPLATGLARLAPTVDLGASRELFERMRDGGEQITDAPAPRDRWLLAAACVLLLVAGLAGVWAIAGNDGTLPADAPAPPGRGDGTEFRVIAREPVGDPDRRGIWAAGTTDELEQRLAGYSDGFDRYAAELDPRNEVAIVIERLDNGCPLDVERFTPNDDTWRVTWSEPTADACEDVGYGWVYILAARRSALDGITRFVLPAEQQGTLSWDELSVAVPGATPDAERPVDRPPVPGPEERAARLARFPVANEGDPDDVAQLIAAHDRGEDWTGTLTGVLFHDVPTGEWWICWEINESLPEQCGTGIRLDAAPNASVERPGDFDEQRSPDSDEVVVVISRDPQAVTGTWFDDAAIFVEDRVPSRTVPGDGDGSDDPVGTLLLETAGNGSPGAVLVATAEPELRQLWQRVGIDTDPPTVDFGRSVVVLFSFVDDSCPASFSGLTVSSEAAPVVRPLLTEDPAENCGEPTELRSYVVLVDEDRLPRRFTFALPDEYAGGGPTRTPVDVDRGFVVDVTAGAELAIEPGRALLVDATSARFGQIVAAEDQAAYDDMWTQVGGGASQPPVDFERDVVVAFVVPDDACAPEFDGFLREDGPDGSVWTPVLREVDRTCRLPLVSRLVLVAVSKDRIAGGTVFRLPANPVDGYGEQNVSVAIDVVTLVEQACGPTDGPALAVQIALVDDDTSTVEVRRDDTLLGSAVARAGAGAPIGDRIVHQLLIPLDRSAAPGDEVVVRAGSGDSPIEVMTVDATAFETELSCG